MKRKILILSVLAICIATLAAGTIAFFTAEGKAHNVITTGGVEIAVQEWADDEKTKPFENLSGVMLNTTDWTEKDGYYYYKEALKPGEVTAPIFTAVTFKPEMGNEYQNATATVDVSAQAVQTANNGDTVMDAKGWPNS